MTLILSFTQKARCLLHAASQQVVKGSFGTGSWTSLRVRVGILTMNSERSLFWDSNHSDQHSSQERSHSMSVALNTESSLIGPACPRPHWPSGKSLYREECLEKSTSGMAWHSGMSLARPCLVYRLPCPTSSWKETCL